MKFDIIPITQTELDLLTVVQTKMLRTAQLKKNELYMKAEKELENFREMLMSAGTVNSTLYEAKKSELDADCAYQTAILADNLIYNMKLNEPSTDGDLGSRRENGAVYGGRYREKISVELLLDAVRRAVQLQQIE